MHMRNLLRHRRAMKRANGYRGGRMEAGTWRCIRPAAAQRAAVGQTREPTGDLQRRGDVARPVERETPAVFIADDAGNPARQARVPERAISCGRQGRPAAKAQC